MSEIRFNGVGRTTFFSEETLIRTTVTAAELTSLAVINVTVFNPAPAGGTSGSATFSIVNPLPVTTLVTPTQFVVGSTTQEINVMGTDFVPSSVGLWNGNPRTTNFVSSTELTVSIPASDLTTAGDNNFAVMTPAPGGGTSTTTVISVVNPQPVLVQLLPPSVVAGSPDFLLTVNGTDFINGIQLLWNGSPRASTFVNSTQFTALIPAADVASPGGVEISARNPAPALADASTAGFTVTGAPFAPGGSEEFSNSWRVTGPLNIGRTALTATRLQNGAVLITGGHALFADGQIGSPLAASELFDPVTGTWQVAGNMQIARVGHSATFVPWLDVSGSPVDGLVLVIGGDSGGGLSAARTAEMFSARDRRWRSIEAPLFGHIGHTATLLADGRVLVVGGEDGSGAVTSAVEIYDPRTGLWTAVASLNTPRSAHTAELLNDGRVMIIGGRNLTSSLTSIEIFDPGSGSWSESAPLGLARNGHTSTLLADGRVLVAGGATESTAATAELFDPLSGKWTDAGKLNAGRSGHVAATLADGRILIGGGQDSDGNILTSCETFDPRTGKWTSAARLNYSRTGHAALVLENGRILVAGGRTGTSKSRDDAPPANPRSHVQRQR
jgi:N-acetylneuraminic acid mutarotase